MMPAILDDKCGTSAWYEEQKYTHAIPILYNFNIPHGEEQALWPMRYSLPKLKNLLEGDVYTANSQYMGRPTLLGGSLFKDEWWQYYDELPHDKIKYLRIYADTAHKTGQQNDYSVFECWGYSEEGNIYLLDVLRDKWEAPELKKNFLAFYNKWKINNKYTRYTLNCAKIEDKASGIGLIQELKRVPGVIIIPIQREKDKVTRAMGVAPVIQSGRVFLPSQASWLETFQDEVGSFSPTMSHKHDDQCDPMFDAVEDMIINGVNLWSETTLGNLDSLIGTFDRMAGISHWG